MPFLAPVFAAIGAGITAIGATAIGSFLLKTGASLLLTAAAQALTKQPGNSGVLNAQDRTLTVRQPVAPREFVYGRARKGGVIVFLHSSPQTVFNAPDAVNGRLNIIIVFAQGPVRKIGNIYFDGELAVPDGAEYSVGRFAPFFVQCERATGTADQFAFPKLRGELPDLWTVNHRLRGVVAIRLALVFNPDVFPTGLPNITADIEGRNDIFDPRTGAFGYSENPPLCLANYKSDPVFGIGAAIGAEDGINTAALVAAANICDEVVATPGGGTEPRYACNGVLDLSVTPKANIEGMLTANAGTCGWQAGQWFLYSGAYRAPVLTLTADDIVGEGITVSTRISRSDLFNGARGTFVSPANDWQPDDFPAYASAAYLAEDRGERSWRDMALPYTIVPGCAQRLAKIDVERVRRQMTVELSGKMRAWQATVGDTVLLTYPRLGISAKPFDVVRASLELQEADGGVALVPRLTLRETSPLVYDWLASEAQIYAAAPRTTLPTPWFIDAPGGLSVTERLVQARPGSPVMAVARIKWQPSPSAFVAQYQVEERQGAAAWNVLGRTDGLFFDREAVQPGRWEYRVKAVSGIGVSSQWSSAVFSIGGLAAPPVAIAGLSIQSIGGSAYLKWNPVSDLDVVNGGLVLIRHSAATVPNWQSSIVMTQVPGSATSVMVPLMPGAYSLRAQDAWGVLGPETVVLSSGATALAFAPVVTLTENPTFSGTRTNVIVDSSQLRLASAGSVDSVANFDLVPNVDILGGVAPSGVYLFAAGMDLGSVRRVRLRSIIEASALGLSGSADAWANVDDINNVDGADALEVGVEVQVRLTNDNPSGTPTWGPWQRADSSEVQARGVQARAELTSRLADVTPTVSRLGLIAEEIV